MKKILYILFIFIISTNVIFAAQKSNENIDLDSYFNDVNKTCKKNWQPPIRPYSYNVVTKMEINKKGEIIDCKITKSSGDKNIDEYAMEAIRKSQPFDPLPSGFTGESVTVENIFYSTVTSDFLLIKFVKDTNNKTFYKSLENKQAQKAYKKYIKEISNRLAIIAPEKYNRQKKMTLEFDVNNQGDAENIKIIKNSDSKVFDNKIIKGIDNIKFAPYPKELRDANIQKVHLNYTIKTNVIQPTMYPILLPIPLYY